MLLAGDYMKKAWLAVVVLSQIVNIAVAQSGKSEDSETLAIRNALQLYTSTDPAKVKDAFYPSANLYAASEQGELRIIPLEQFLANVAKGAASGQARPAGAVDFIDRVGNAATARMTETSSAVRITDYFSLVRGSAGWRVVSKTFNVERIADAAGATPKAEAGNDSCPSNEVRAFDYMIGEWTTSDPNTPTGVPSSGSSRTEKILGGCVILEHRYVEQKGKKLFDAKVAWGYDSTTNRMLVFYYDDQAHAQVYEGRRENGGWAFYRERPDPDGKMVQIRLTYVPKGKGFDQIVERSRDQGKTWAPPSATSYSPKP